MSQKKRRQTIDHTRLLLGIVMIPLAASCVLALAGGPRWAAQERFPEQQRPVAVRAVLASDRERGVEGDLFSWDSPESETGEHHTLHHTGGAPPAVPAAPLRVAFGAPGLGIAAHPKFSPCQVSRLSEPVRGPPRAAKI